MAADIERRIRDKYNQGIEVVKTEIVEEED
jgi:hypothetical protein